MRALVALPRIRIPGRRLLIVVTAITLPVLVAADAGSVALVKLSAGDNASEAARAGMTALPLGISNATPQLAQQAYDAANAVAELHGMNIDEQTFVLEPNGSVRLTASRTAPTILFKHVPGLRDLTHTTVAGFAVRAHW